MPNIDLTELLERHGVKTTANRLIVAKALLTEGRPLSRMELEDKIGPIDKSGIFIRLTRAAGTGGGLEDLRRLHRTDIGHLQFGGCLPYRIVHAESHRSVSFVLADLIVHA